MINIWECEACGCAKDETPKIYLKERNKFQKDLCNKHYIQMNRHGRITDWDEKVVKKCDICGDAHDIRKYGISDNEYNGMELCTKHYTQVRLKGEITDINPSHLRDRRVCSFCGSDDDVVFSTEIQAMLCRKHYSQQRQYGKLFKRTIFDKNEIIEKDNHAEILLYDINHTCIAKALIDLDDIDIVKKHKWGFNCGYVETKNNSLHRFIMSRNNDIEGKIIDHIDRNPLNNKKDNLRIVDKSINAINAGIRQNNKSGVTGVSYTKRINKWRAYVNYKKERIELGYFDDKNEAIKRRLQAELEFYGKYAPQIHLFEEYEIVEGGDNIEK